MPNAELLRDWHAVPRHDSRECRLHLRDIVRMHQLERAAIDSLVSGVAEQPLRGSTGIAHEALLVDENDGIRAVLDEGLEQIGGDGAGPGGHRKHSTISAACERRHS